MVKTYPLPTLIKLLIILSLVVDPLLAQHGGTDVAQNNKRFMSSTGAIVWEPAPARNPLRYFINSPCTGVLLCSNTVLTAAHCVRDARVGSVYFTLSVGPVSYAGVGAAFQQRNQNQVRRLDMNTVQIQDYLARPPYGLAMVQLREPFNLRAAPVNAANFFPTLVPANHRFVVNSVGKVAGYGANAPYNLGATPRGAGRLREGTMNLRRVFQVGESPRGNPVTTNILDYIRGNTNGCEGDSGGPVFVGENDLLAGILDVINDRPIRSPRVGVPARQGCTSAAIPIGGGRTVPVFSHYIQLASHRTWIDRNLNAWCPERRGGGGNDSSDPEDDSSVSTQTDIEAIGDPELGLFGF